MIREEGDELPEPRAVTSSAGRESRGASHHEVVGSFRAPWVRGCVWDRGVAGHAQDPGLS